MEVQAPMIAKTVLRKCGRISFAKTSDHSRHFDYQKPDPVQQRAAFTIRQVKKSKIQAVKYKFNNLISVKYFREKIISLT